MSQTSSGYAAAEPVGPRAIHTDSTGLIAGLVEFPAADRSLPVYAAQPDASEGSYPIVLVMMEIFGLHEYIKDICRRFAKRGYLAIAPDIFARAGDPTKMTDMSEIRTKVIQRTPDAQVISDLDAAVAWAISERHGNPNQLGITGFCWGGRTVWLYSAHNPSLKAGVAWYGRLDGDHSENQPVWPVDVAARLHGPVLGLYGGNDQGIPLDTVDRMNGLLRDAGSPSHIDVYPDSGHAFHADYRDHYNEADAHDGEARMYAWFKEHGVG